MRKQSKRLGNRLGWGLSGIALLGLLTGCSPAAQHSIAPKTGQLLPLSEGTVSTTGWNRLVSAAQLGQSATMYYLNMSVDVANSTNTSTMSFYGPINPPDRIGMTMNIDGVSSQYYQQGQSAFKRVNGNWTQSAPLTGLNVYDSYATLIDAAATHQIPVYQFPQQYVVDEYCRVYEAKIPSSLVRGTPLWPTASTSTTGDLFMAFYVGKSSGELREVDLAAAGGAAGTGSLVTHVHAVLFDINSKVSKVAIPSTLVYQLSGQ